MQVGLVQVLVVVLAFAVSLGAAMEPLADKPKSEPASCNQEKFKSIQDCATCCAIGGHNKFDRQAYLADDRRECRCYNDDKEIKFNQTPGRKPAARN